MIPTSYHAPLYTPRPPAQVNCPHCGCIIDPVIAWCASCDWTPCDDREPTDSEMARQNPFAL